ncbi:hypothetical protein CPB86DRAFT_778728 [Serendipita vermifera]|nr:hypothetical protein CPB86DRAFT_778728 [Serendipita vermifera]
MGSYSLGDWIKHDGYWKYNKQIEKPLLDDRSYELIRLDNELQVLLVSDPGADLAGVSLDVGVGHMADPDDMPGLAHFCEHLSFMGTEDFPIENEYKKYIKKHGGMTNASTSSSTTTYHFQVQSAFLSGAIHRFAGFFHSPLFAPSCVAREVNAVNSENSKNQQMDNRRIYQLWKSLSDANHPWNKFGCGSKSTLMENESTDGEAQTRARVVEWWKNNYCSSRMKVAIIGADPMNALIELACRHFSLIPNRNLGPLPLTKEFPWNATAQPKIVFVETVQDIQRLEINFPIPYQSPLYKSKPYRYASHLIGHEGPGSAFYLLHQRGLATSLSCGLHAAGRGFSLLHIDIILTKAGLEHYLTVLSVLFNYVTLLRNALQEPHHFEEVRRMSEINFLYTSKYNPDAYATLLSHAMNDDIEREHILSRGVFDWKFDPLNIEKLISCLTPQQSRIFVAAKNFNVLELSGSWEKERWYGTKFLQQDFSPATLKKLSPEDISALYLPDKNEFLPSSLDVDKITVESPLKAPEIVKSTEKYILWHKKDDQFWQPRGSITVKLQSPLMTGNLPFVVRTRIYVGLALDALQGPAYMTTLAGISFDIYVDVDGIIVEVVGYNDKLRNALDMILLHFVNLEIRKERFDVVTEKIGRSYDNVYMRQSREVSDMFLSQVRSEKLMTAPEKRKELNETTIDHIQLHKRQLFETSFFTLLVHGNISRDQAIVCAEEIQRIISGRPLPLSQRASHRTLLLPTGCNYAYDALVPNVDEENSAISFYCHVGDVADPRTRALNSLLSSMINEPFFNVMRTQEQLGYSVSCIAWASTSSLGLRFRVQSTRHPKYLEHRIEEFINTYRETLRSMSPEEYLEHRNGVVEKKRKKLVNLGEERARYWGHIDNGYLDFARAENEAQEIETIELKDLIDFYERFVHSSSPFRSKLSIRLTSQQFTKRDDEPSDYATPGDHRLEIFKDILSLRENLIVSGAARPNVSYTGSIELGQFQQ